MADCARCGEHVDTTDPYLLLQAQQASIRGDHRDGRALSDDTYLCEDCAGLLPSWFLQIFTAKHDTDEDYVDWLWSIHAPESPEDLLDTLEERDKLDANELAIVRNTLSHRYGGC
jgi:hypothetical protein